MEYKQASEILDTYVFDKIDLGGRGKAVAAFVEACAMGAEALEKADRCQWHNLNLNPEDLPSLDVEQVLVKVYENYCIVKPIKGTGPRAGETFWLLSPFDAWRYLD